VPEWVDFDNDAAQPAVQQCAPPTADSDSEADSEIELDSESGSDSD
jgi:hypothetical protein